MAQETSYAVIKVMRLVDQDEEGNPEDGSPEDTRLGMTDPSHVPMSENSHRDDTMRWDGESDEDDAAAPGRSECHYLQSNKGLYATIEHNICYSHIYREPVLYIAGYYSDGTYMSIDGIRRMVNRDAGDGHGGEFPTCTHESHPVRQTPCFMIHPCNTGATIHQAFENTQVVFDEEMSNDELRERKAAHYILTWLSIIGKYIHLVPAVTMANRIHRTSRILDT